MSSKRSDVWNYFELTDNKNKVKCRLCPLIMSYHSRTSNMKLHLKSKHNKECHPRVNPTKEEMEGNAGRTISDMLRAQKTYPLDSPRHKLLTRKLTEMLAIDVQPFKIVEDPGFRAFVNAMDPKFQLPGRQGLSKREIPDLYEEKKRELKEELKEAEHVAITMDSWTSRQTKEYLGVTAHYFRMPDYKLQSKVLSTKDLNDDPTGENIGNALLAVLTEWEILEKVSAVVTDGAAVNGAALRHIGLKDKHSYCVGHKLNLTVKYSITDYEPVIGKVRRIASFFHHSPKQTNKLETQQQSAGKTPLKVIIDVQTRWNSTYHMMKRYLELHQFINAALTLEGKIDMLITEMEFDLIKMLTGALQPFDDATKIVSADKYPTVSIVFPVVRELFERTQSLPDSEIKKNLLLRMGKDFRDLESNRLYSIATFLDPRFKDLYFVNDNTLARIKADLEQDLKLFVCLIEDNLVHLFR